MMLIGYLLIALIIFWWAYKEPVPKIKKARKKRRVLLSW